MPLTREQWAKYPADWKQRRARILERAGHRCESCGLPDHAVGYRGADGRFVPLAGNGPCDAAGEGKQWPSYDRLSFAAAKEFADFNNDCNVETRRRGVYRKRQTDDDGNRWFVIVLTIAHLDEGDLDCGDDRLMALCERCHNKLDAPMRARHRAEKRLARASRSARQLSLMDGDGA